MSSHLAESRPLLVPDGAPIARRVQNRSLLGGPDQAPAPFPPVLAKGFRLFFLLAGAYAVLLLPVWLSTLAGVLTPIRYFDAITWHAHEMLFGFTVAVIAGFLLTAVSNWTGRETLNGGWLAAAGAVWVAGRVAMTLPGAFPRGVPAVVDLAFLPLLAIAIARPLFAAKNARNFVMVAVLLVLWGANLAVHLDALGVVAGARTRAMGLAIDVTVLLMIVISGRVFPMFTKNGSGVATVAGHPTLDKLAVAAMLATTVVDVAGADARVGAAAAAGTALIVAARARRWGAQHTLAVPLLWVLHAGHAWIVVGLALRALAVATPLVLPMVATHALTVGAVGCLTLGMMSRVALGHTGRLLQSSPPMVASFVVLSLAAVVRVLAPLVAPSAYRTWVFVAGGLWTVAFALFIVVVGPMLVAPRVDGKAG